MMLFKWIKSHFDQIWSEEKANIKRYAHATYWLIMLIILVIAILLAPTPTRPFQSAFEESIFNFCIIAAIIILVIPAILYFLYRLFRIIRIAWLDYAYFAANGGKLKRNEKSKVDEPVIKHGIKPGPNDVNYDPYDHSEWDGIEPNDTDDDLEWLISESNQKTNKNK